MMLFRANVYAFAALYFLFVKGQGTQNVIVGLQGSFYDPQYISAGINDTIVFQFVGDIHTVTQSSFDAPCSPLPGGFNSGLAGRSTNSSAPIPTWSLVITNVSSPIWFFCAATRPSSHCTAGMVGVINTPSIDMYNQFVKSAKLVTGTPVPIPTVILTGQGAFATKSPSPPPITSSPPLTTSSTLPTSTSSTPIPTKTAATAVSPTTTHLGAIVGGSVGGAIALIGLIIIFWLFYLRKRKAHITPESDDFFRYNPVPARRPSDAFVEAKRAEDLRHNASVTSDTNTNISITPTARFSPLRRPPTQMGPVILQPPNLHRQPSAQSDLLSSNVSTGHSPLEQQPSNIDIRTLAQEVAAVLYQSPPTPHGHRKDPMTIQNPNHDDLDYAGISQSQPPPNYRAATGPSPSPVPRGRVRNT